MKKIIAVMPIKLDNERCPGKNTRLLGDMPLLNHQLTKLLHIKEIDKVYVYCSDETIVPLLPLGVHFLKRPKELDLPTSNFSQIFATFMKQVDADIYVFDHATAPFVTIDTIHTCLNVVLAGEYDSAFCATKIQDFLWQNGVPLNFDPTNLPRSQDIKPIYRETSGVYIFQKEVFEKYHRRIGIKPYIHEVSYKEAIDINNPEDFQLAEVMLNINL
jgi:CMP-N-acetylneuraminic acid synthetase